MFLINEMFQKHLNVLLWISGRVFANAPDTASVIGMKKKVMSFSPVTELKAHTDFE